MPTDRPHPSVRLLATLVVVPIVIAHAASAAQATPSPTPIATGAMTGTASAVPSPTPIAAAPPPASAEVPYPFDGVEAPGGGAASLLRAQVLLDRAHFSVGEIDNRKGARTAGALAAFQRTRGLDATGRLDAPTWQALETDRAPILGTYVVTDADVAGPFAPIPRDPMEQARQPALGFGSAVEALAERFHASPALLAALNPGRPLDVAGTTLVVPNVASERPAAAARLTVDASEKSVTLLDDAGTTVARYPATIGSRHDPLPVGRWKINGVAWNPPFHYNPDLFWDADEDHAKAVLPPGPNSPVGVVWIDLSKPHYGIHGTPEPGRIGFTTSHGCIRLTNWDAIEVAQLVKPGTPAVLQQ